MMDFIWIIGVGVLAIIGAVMFGKLLSAPTDRVSNPKVVSICPLCTNLEIRQSGVLRRCLKQDSFIKEMSEEDAWEYMAQRLGGGATDCTHFLQDVCSICGAVRGTHRSQCPNSSNRLRQQEIGK